MYFTYLLRCKDDSLYCGYTNDIVHRMELHKAGKGAKYVRAKGFHKLEFYIVSNTKSDAMKFEVYIKKLSKFEKEKLVRGECNSLDRLGIYYQLVLSTRI